MSDRVNECSPSRLCYGATGEVYMLVDPRTNKCRYVGLTTVTESRQAQHEDCRVYQGNIALLRWKQELARQGDVPLFVVLESDIPGDGLTQRERHWVRVKISEGCELLNRPVGAIKRTDLVSNGSREECVKAIREARQLLCDAQFVSGVRVSSAEGKAFEKCQRAIEKLISKIT